MVQPTVCEDVADNISKARLLRSTVILKVRSRDPQGSVALCQGVREKFSDLFFSITFIYFFYKMLQFKEYELL